MIYLDGGRHVIRCNHCKQPVHAIYRHQHLKECRAYIRRQKLGRMNFEKNGRKLYAVALVRFNGQEWVPEMHYTHAESQSQARNSVLFGERDRSRVAIVDAGLAIGMFAVDRDGMQLVAD